VKSAELSPYKVTIAHGFLTLSLVVHLGTSVPIQDPKAAQGMVMGINYGLDKVRFPAPVPVNSKLRAERTLLAVEMKASNTLQLSQRITVEIEGQDKPACVAQMLFRAIYS
jgi:acyl dehydratase